MTTRRSIPAPAEALLGSDALAHVITRNPDGSPQVSVVWCGVRGERVLFCTEGASAKARNIERDPRVILSIEDDQRSLAGKQQHLVIHGTAAIIGPAERRLCEDLCRMYVGRVEHALNLSRSPSAVTVAVDVERIGGSGPWMDIPLRVARTPLLPAGT